MKRTNVSKHELGTPNHLPHRFSVWTLAIGFLLFANLLFFSQPAHAAGVTIITHGFQLAEYEESPDSWLHAMADAVVQRAGGADAVTVYTLQLEAKTVFGTGEYFPDIKSVTYTGPAPYSPAHNGETIFIVNWSDLGGFTPVVSTESLGSFLAGHFLTDSVSNHKWIEHPIHLIGHSRGASALSVVAKRLAEQGVWVDQLTTLDPHPWSGAADADVKVYDNVVFADNYYENYNCTYPAGISVDGTSYLLLNSRFRNDSLCDYDCVTLCVNWNCAGDCKQWVNHGRVHDWYHGTIDTDATTVGSDPIARAAWYTSSEQQGAATGFYFSRMAGGTMAGTGNTRPSTGLRSAGASRTPVAVTATGANAWDNIEIVDFPDDRSVQQGASTAIHAYWDDNGSVDATIQIGLDTDSNPYNGTLGPPLFTQGPTSASGYINTSLFTLSATPDTYHVYAKISNSQHARYYYARGRLIVSAANHSPGLSNGRVSPASGTTATTFEFLVDYYDPDGNPPYPGYPKVYLSNGVNAQMTLKSGSAANGTYHYTTTLSPGSYSYFFSAIDTGGGSIQTGWYSGPSVYSTGKATIDIVIQCTRISSDLRLKYSTTGSSGPWTDIPITKAILDPLVVPAGSTVYFWASVASDNYEFRSYDLFENGSLTGSSAVDLWWFKLGTSTTEVGLNVYYRYTPQFFSISGTVSLNGGGTVPGGVDLILSSSEQTMTNHTDNGNWSFSSVLGGVSVTVTPQANGYTFSPASLVFNNLDENKTAQAFAAYSSDDYAPTAQFTTLPPSVATNAAVSFAWSGQDNVSLPANLVYQFKLDGADTDWSAFASATSADYSLSNGCYSFWVRAKDQAGNENQAPSSYTFVVNAAPKILSAVRNTRSVWSSRVTVQMPNGAPNPSNRLILLPEHSGMTDSDLVPVRIHRADQVTPSGANAIIASQVGLPVSIIKTNMGWLVTLPDNLSPGQTTSYDIVWGKVEYFGWKDSVTIPVNLPNGGYIASTFLNDDYRIWRLATKIVQYGNAGEQKSWVIMNVSDVNGAVVPETVLRHQYGHPWDGSLASQIDYGNGVILKTDARLCLLWWDEKYAWDGVNNYYYDRYSVQFLDSNGLADNARDSQYVDGDSIHLPKNTIRSRVWLTGWTSGPNTADPNSAWFEVLDADGNTYIVRTQFDTIQSANSSSFREPAAFSAGTNTLLVWNRKWRTSLNKRREEIAYQIRNDAGQLVKPTTSFTPLLSDSTNVDDQYVRPPVDAALVGNDGKVWISYPHTTSGQPTNYMYVIIGADGNIWKGPVQTFSQRYFRFCDRDGLIWASENGQFFALNANDTTNVPPRAEAWTPNQQVGAIAGSVSADGYRLYDRWSPQVANVDVPLVAMPMSMELYDLNLWSNDLHAANITIQNGSSNIWNQSGQFTGHVAVAVSGNFSEGQNILTLTQNDFHGGQVLITFPYVFNHIVAAAGDANVAVSPAGDVVVTNGSSVTFTITPSQYFHIANVTIDGASVGTNTSYTFSNVTQDHTLQAYSAANLATPVASFTASPTLGAVPLAVNFTDTSTGVITNRAWDFGDGGASAVANVIHGYNSPGVYSVSLSVFGPGGSDKVTSNNLITATNSVPEITSPPAATNTVGSVGGITVVKPGQAIGFSVGSNDADGNPLNCLWNFGDGATSTDCNPSHVFTNCGPHDVSVTMNDGFASVSTTMTVAVACPMTINTLTMQVKFNRNGVDSSTIKGALSELPAEFSIANAKATLIVGDAQLAFQLDTKGRAGNQSGSIKFTRNKKTGAWTFSGKLKGDYRAAWAKYGLVNDSVASASVAVPVLLVLQSNSVEAFEKESSLGYTAKAEKSGTARLIPGR